MAGARTRPPESPRRGRAAGPDAGIPGSGRSELPSRSLLSCRRSAPFQPRGLPGGHLRPPRARPPEQPQRLSPHFLLLVSQLFTNSPANTPPSPSRGQTPPLPTYSSWWLVRESRRPGPGLQATLRGRAGGRDNQGIPGSGPLWLRMHLGRFQHHLHPQVLSGSRGGPAWTRGKGSDRLSVSSQKEKKKTYQVVCRRD